jgi:hypothetical protein
MQCAVVTEPSGEALSEAMVVWTGYGEAVSPRREEARLVTVFGDEGATSLLPHLRRLEADFYESEARHDAPDLVQMGRQASDEFRRRHPDVSDAAVEALAWCYTFDFK